MQVQREVSWMGDGAVRSVCYKPVRAEPFPCHYYAHFNTAQILG